MPTPHVTILGAGYAGQMAAARIAKRRPDVRLTVIDASATFVERIRLHQIAAGGSVRARPMATLLPGPARFNKGCRLADMPRGHWIRLRPGLLNRALATIRV